MWTCPSCETSVDPGVDRCRGCGGRRPSGVEDEALDGTIVPDRLDKAGTKPDPPLACLRCQGPMREGSLAAHPLAARSTRVLPVLWHPGRLKWSWWLGHVARPKRFSLQVFRCERCGRLESFANG